MTQDHSAPQLDSRSAFQRHPLVILPVLTAITLFIMAAFVAKEFDDLGTGIYPSDLAKLLAYFGILLNIPFVIFAQLSGTMNVMKARLISTGTFIVLMFIIPAVFRMQLTDYIS